MEHLERFWNAGFGNFEALEKTVATPHNEEDISAVVIGEYRFCFILEFRIFL
jgi:hypothetical protein